MLNKPSILEYDRTKFMIFSAPDENSLEYWIKVQSLFLKEFKTHNVTDIVRTCEKTYSEESILNQKIRIHVSFN